MSETAKQIYSFGTWLRNQRQVRGWVQKELAMRTGCAVGTIKKLETDERRPSRPLAAQLATALGFAAEKQALIVQAARGLLTVDQLARSLPPRNPFAPALTMPGPQDAVPLGSQRHQLRTPLPDFVGQEAAITGLLEALRQTRDGRRVAALSSVRGMGGIGKTELAILVANQLIDEFPDAQIVLNLQGTSDLPLPPTQALQQAIHTFTPDVQLPDNLEALQRHYHSVLHNQRVLIVADDAHDAAQVRWLLPPSSCALLITSRRRFSLPGMTAIDLELLGEEEATRLLRSICPRLRVEEAKALAQACGYLPLALRISGSLLANDVALSVSGYLSGLRDERQRLAHLYDPDDRQFNVESVLALSYAQLDDLARQVFCQLGVLAGDFSTELAQATVEVIEGGDAAATLHLLLRRNLIMHDSRVGRWRLHDLLRDLAKQRLEAMGEADATQRRYACAALVIAQDIQEQYLAGGDNPLLALSRFDTERTHFDAARCWAQRHLETPAGDQLLLDIARATRYIGSLRYDPRRESIPQWEGVRAAARRLGNHVEEARAFGYLGNAYQGLGELHTAIAYHEQSLIAFRELGDHRSEGIALSNLGHDYYRLGEIHTAIRYLQQDLAITREFGDQRGEGFNLNHLGNAYLDLSEISKAINHYEQARTIARNLGDRSSEGYAILNLGNSYTELGNTRRAIETCEEALTIARTIGDRRVEATTLNYLARAQAIQGNIKQAAATFTQAIAIFREMGNRYGEAECHWLFGLALAQHGKSDQALPLLRAALAYQQEIGHTKAPEHAALIARLEAGEALPSKLHIPVD